ncbi:MAG: DnaJ domain-containing protein [Thermodesulfobacteriota bacterium]
MSWLFGASMGWFVGGPVGAVVGGAIQHVFSSAKMKQIGQSDAAAKPEMIFISNLVAIMTKICMADGHISTEERRVIHKFFESSLGYSGENLKFIDAMIDETDRQNPDLKQIVFAFDRFANHEQRLILLDLAYNIAAVDHTITEGEQNAINDIVAGLNISQAEHERIRGRHTVVKVGKNYAILGVDRSASNEEIKKAYRQLAMQYHPDKVSHLGQELIDFSNKKFQEINNSYQTIKKERGL